MLYCNSIGNVLVHAKARDVNGKSLSAYILKKHIHNGISAPDPCANTKGPRVLKRQRVSHLDFEADGCAVYSLRK